jgi:ribosomal protein S18
MPKCGFGSDNVFNLKKVNKTSFTKWIQKISYKMPKRFRNFINEQQKICW